jgi:hypothetical protein
VTDQESYINSYRNEEVLPLLIGRKVVAIDYPSLTLDDGSVLTFDTENDDCCSYIELKRLTATDHVITAASFMDNEDETGGEGPYRASLYVLTEAGGVHLAEADGDASNGYYLHGFALGVKVARGRDT